MVFWARAVILVYPNLLKLSQVVEDILYVIILAMWTRIILDACMDLLSRVLSFSFSLLLYQ